jgi:Cof subfamily protein (haloacid dehalogenase superfamily)
MDIRCIVLDMDMTTLGTDKKISDANRDALEYVISKGIHVAIASGRPLSSLPQDVVSIPGVEYAITSNGAAIYHIPSGSRMAHYTLEPETVEKVVAVLKEQPYACEAFVDGKGYSPAEFIADPTQFGAPAYAGKYLRRTRTPVSDIHAFILEHKHQLDSISVITDSLSISNHLYPLLRKELPNCYLTCSADHMVEIAHRDCGKHTAVRFLAEHLQLTPDQIAAFGDGDNDAEMLAYVGQGIAVANASPACLAAADHVSLHFSESAVAYGIHQILQL